MQKEKRTTPNFIIKAKAMKHVIAAMLFSLFAAQGRSQQLYYLSDIPANPNFGVALQDTHLFVVKNFGVSSYLISQPQTPGFITSVTPQYWPLTLFADGNYLFCGGGMMGQLAVLDISQPASMSIVHEDPSVSGTVYQFAKTAQHLYFTTNQDTLFAADVSNPASPVITARIALSTAFAEGSVVAGNRLFIGSTGGILVYDISIPSQPIYLSNYPGSFRKLFYNAQDEQLYAGLQNGNIAVYSTADINALVLQYQIPADAGNFTATKNRIAVLTNAGGVTLYEAGQTAALTLGTFTTPAPGGQQNAIAMQDSIIAYTTVNSTYLLKYGFVNPQGIVEYKIPNNGLLRYSMTAHTVRWNMQAVPGSQLLRLTCYDASGRMIFTGNNSTSFELAPGTVPAGYLLEFTNGETIHGKFQLEK